VKEHLLTRGTPLALMHGTINPDCLRRYLHTTHENSTNASSETEGLSNYLWRLGFLQTS